MTTAGAGRNVNRFVLAGVTALLIAAADQASKRWAVGALTDGERRATRAVHVIPDYFEFRYSENTGSAFGLFQEFGGVLTVVGVAALGFVFWLLYRHPGARKRSVVALGLIGGGAIGNLWDRFQLGYVVDFVVWTYRHQYTWPAFNIADAALCVGVGMIIVWPEQEPAAARADADRARP